MTKSENLLERFELMTDDLLNADEEYMLMALSEAVKGASMGEVPVGAVIVKDGKVIAEAHNMRENGGGATAHAELLAVEKACRALGTWRLSGCTMYVTLEPCPMCAGAIINARMDRLVYGAKDPSGGAMGSVVDLGCYPFYHNVETLSGVLAEESLELLKDFFRSAREPKKN